MASAQDPRAFEPRVDTSQYLDKEGHYTPDPARSVDLPSDRQPIVNTVIEMYNGKIESRLDDFRAVYHPLSVYDDIMSFADTRKKVATQFFALPKCFSDVSVREHQVATNEDNLIVIKLRTAYTAPVLGTKEIRHLVTLALDTATSPPTVRYHKDQWNEKDYSHSGIGAVFKKFNGETLPKVMNIPDDL